MEIPDDLDSIRIMTNYNSERVAIRLGLTATFFIEDTHKNKKQARLRLAQCGDDYQSMVGEHLKYYLRLGGEGRLKKYPKKGVPLVDKINNDYPDDKSFAPCFSGSDLKDDASVYSLDFMSVSTKYFLGREKCAAIALTLPFSWLKDKSGEQAFQSIIHRWCQILRPQHAYAGLGVIQSVDMTEKMRTCWQARIR